MSVIHPVILSGGSGTRLWPVSRLAYPKQFHRLVTEHTLLQDTVRRLAPPLAAPPVIVASAGHRFEIGAQLDEIGVCPRAIVLEPVGRNTAPAVAAAALILAEEAPESVMLVLPADHHIRDEAGFRSAVQQAATLAAAGNLVTFGITPHRPETGYGYIRRGAALGEGAFKVGRFVEKPDLATAEQYLAAGDYVWNSGMFAFRPDRFLAELERFEPEMLIAVRAAVTGSAEDLDFLRLAEAPFAASPATSIDYAVMERTDKAVVLPIDIGWSDVGSWQALWSVAERDGDGNRLIGDVITVDSAECFVRSDGPLVTAVGIEGLTIVATDDAVFVAPRERSQDVGEIVKRLKAAQRPEAATHQRVHRPWGFYETVTAGGRYQVKHLRIKPGAALSLQMHHHRSEHWIVVSGTARVNCGDDVRLLSENESTYIPIGVRHRLENPGRVPLDIIEVQSGSYLGEDDIVRLEDRYHRAPDEAPTGGGDTPRLVKAKSVTGPG